MENNSISTKPTEKEEDDDTKLSAHTLAALQEFLAEQALKQQIEDVIVEKEEVVDSVSEDWQLSQFWYTDETADIIAKEVVNHLAEISNSKGRIACVSTPSIFRAFKRLNPSNEFILFEYDKRFAKFGSQFIFYDYNHPTDIDIVGIAHSFDFIICDPPFLSLECFSKVAITLSILAKSSNIQNTNSSTTTTIQSPFIFLTGTIMEPILKQLFGEDNIKLCKFKPKHEKHLQNEFSCFTNYNSVRLSEIE